MIIPQSDYLDLHISLENIPDFSFLPGKIDTAEGDMKFAGRFIQRLQELLSKGKQEELLQLYEVDFQLANETVFSSKGWPEPHEIESTQPH